jgi:hypothetical protein
MQRANPKENPAAAEKNGELIVRCMLASRPALAGQGPADVLAAKEPRLEVLKWQ